MYDSLQLHSGPLCAVRGATPPSSNNLSHANRVRPAALADKLFWSMLENMRTQSPGFGKSYGGRFALRFKATINVVDSTTISKTFNAHFQFRPANPLFIWALPPRAHRCGAALNPVRSGCVWKIGKGRVFYFRPGHETYGVYQQAEPLRVMTNAVRWLGVPARQSGIRSR